MKKHIMTAVLANLMFGIMPLYWKLLATVPNTYVLACRMVSSVAFTIAFAALGRKLPLLRQAFKSRRTLVFALLSGITIAGNWLLYIWAVNSGMTAETSLAYYMSPLIVFVFGVTVFREKCTKWGVLAVCLAGCGIALYAVSLGSFPWVAMLLAVTFALYGVLKKLAGLDSAVSLTVEMSLLLPFSLGYMLFASFGADGVGAQLAWWHVLLLVGTGFASAFPLWLYGKGIADLPLSLVSFLQFIWPTTSLILSVTVFRETVSPSKLLCFAFIWAGLLVFTLSNALSSKKRPIPMPTPSEAA